MPHNSIKACVEYVHVHDLFISANRIFTLPSRCEKSENQSPHCNTPLQNYCQILTLFLIVFFFFRKNYLLLSYATSVRPSVRLSSVEIISFHGISISKRPIDLKIGLDVRKGVVHGRKAWFFEILIASCKFMQFAIFCK